MRYYAQNLEKSFFTISNQPEEQYIPQGRAYGYPKPQERVTEQERVIGLDEMLQMADDTNEGLKSTKLHLNFQLRKFWSNLKGN